MESLTAANTQFSLNLFKKISGGNASGNVFFSPVSISSALAMVLLGARGNTAAQMIKVLGFKNPLKPDAATPGHHDSVDQIHSSFTNFMSELNKPGVPYALSLANRLYGEQSYQFVEKFLNDVKRYYEAGLEKVDFKNKSEAACVNINKWVEKKTQEKIKNLVSKANIDENTKLVLVNAIYFKGNWEKKFPKEATRDGQFKLNKIQTKPVKMMHQKSMFPLALIPEMNSQVLELPYVGKNLSMLIILPNAMEDDTTGLQKLEKALTYEKLMEWTKPSKMILQEVQVIHKAFVEVDEEGTEAAAATAIITIGITSVRPSSPPKIFTADHPFLYFIRHNPSNVILFYGRLCSP
ncbi:unnamed protein product [Leuciscus chuanchicus]